MVCRSCSGLAWGEEVRCDSRDCPVFYTRIREKSRLANLKEGVGRVAEELEEGIEEQYPKTGRKKKSRAMSEALEW
jgi:DNA polymerase zeta